MSEPTTTPPARQRRGCLFYGCLTCSALLLFLVLLGFFAVRFLKNRINEYTDAQPMTLPKVEMSAADFDALQARVKSFGNTVDKGESAEPLVLTEQEINALLEKSPNAKDLADKVYVSLDNGEVKGQISIPLSGLGWFGHGRYLNGEAAFNVSLENGVLIVTAQEVRVKGKSLPESFMGRLRKENLAKDIYRDPKNAEAIRKLESIHVNDGRVIIKARGGTNAPPVSPNTI